MRRSRNDLGEPVDEQWFADELRPMWIEREGFPDASLGHPIAGSADMVDTCDAVSITDRQLDDVVAFSEFMAGESFTAQERDEIRQVTLDEFRTAPVGAMRQLLSVRMAIDTIRTSTPIQRSSRRTDAMTRIALAEHGAGVVSEAMAIVYRYNPIVLIDLERGYAISSDTFDAWGAWRRMIAAIVGLSPDAVWDPSNELRRLDGELHTWTDQQLNSLTRAHESWITVRAGLRGASSTHRHEVVETIRHEVGSPADVERVALAMAHIVHVTDLVGSISQFRATGQRAS